MLGKLSRACPRGISRKFATPSVVSTAKHLVLPTVARVPESHEYLMQRQLAQLPAEQLALLHEIAGKDHAKMMASPDLARFLALQCQLIGAKHVLEVGVFRGFTTLVLAQALPEDGRVYGLDICAEFLEGTGRKYWQQAGVEEKIDFRVGPAVEAMDSLLAKEEDGGDEMAGVFDLCFIDADKMNYDNYYERALKLVRQGGVIAVDNVLWSGRFLSQDFAEDPDSVAIAELNDKLFKDDRVSVNMLSIGDGVMLCRVN